MAAKTITGVLVALVTISGFGCSKNNNEDKASLITVEGTPKRSSTPPYRPYRSFGTPAGAHGAADERDDRPILREMTMACTHSEQYDSNIIKRNGSEVRTKNQNSVGVARLVKGHDGNPTIVVFILSPDGGILARKEKSWTGPVKWPGNWVTALYDQDGEGFTFGCRIVWPGQNPELG